jgi:hypothetical protein
MKWPIPTDFTKVRSFVGATQHLWKFIASFSVIATPLHTITASGKSFMCGKNQHNSFDELKIKISQAPVLTLPNLQKPFEVETDASGHAMGAVSMQGGRHVCYHSEVFDGAVLNYPNYDKDVYTLVQDFKKWKHYLMGKDTIIHTDHQPLKYLHAQSKLQKTRHYKWMGILQQFNLVIKYKKGSKNKLADILSKPPTSKITTLGNLMHMDPFTNDAYKEAYIEDEDFKEVFQ